MNLLWSWDDDLRVVFSRLDRDLWDSTYQNPVLMLGTISQERLERLAHNESFLSYYDRALERLNAYLGGETVVIADVGDSLYGAVDLMIHKGTEFLSPAYYNSMGFAVPAAVAGAAAATAFTGAFLRAVTTPARIASTNAVNAAETNRVLFFMGSSKF